MLRTQAVCRPSSQQNRQQRWSPKANLNFSPKLNFSPSTKKTTEYSFQLFSINKIVFSFCCLCSFCYNAGYHAISRQKRGIQHRVISSVCHLILVTLWCGRTDGHVTITSLPKFVALIGYQICSAMVLRWRAPLWINTHVTPPSPIEVKKLMEKRVLRGLSRGKIPSKYSARNLKKGIKMCYSMIRPDKRSSNFRNLNYFWLGFFPFLAIKDKEVPYFLN